MNDPFCLFFFFEFAYVENLFQDKKGTYDHIILNINLLYKVLSSMTGDNYLMETTKCKDRVKVVPKRIKEMAVNFNAPDNKMEDITFKY